VIWMLSASWQPLSGCDRSNYTQEAVGCGVENWDATFTNEWKTADLVDCICSYVITRVVELLSAEGAPAKAVLTWAKRLYHAAFL
jgi:hypothetical protein